MAVVRMVPITNLEGLRAAALHRRAVVCPEWVGFVRPRPAAFVINMSGELLLRMFRSGMYLHIKRETT